VTEPAAAPSGIEVFSLGTDLNSTPRRTAFIAVPSGPEALTVNRAGSAAYTHAGPTSSSLTFDSAAWRRDGYPAVPVRTDSLRLTMAAAWPSPAATATAPCPCSRSLTVAVSVCLTADDAGHYWTCDADHGRVLRFDDP
jgi:hypothetical protein